MFTESKCVQDVQAVSTLTPKEIAGVGGGIYLPLIAIYLIDENGNPIATGNTPQN